VLGLLSVSLEAQADPRAAHGGVAEKLALQKANAPVLAATSYDALLALIEREATAAGVPAEVAEAVMHTESGFNANVVGKDGEIGLMQVLPSTARMMGFSGSLAELAKPETNVRYGVAYLARSWRLAGGDLCTAVMKYRAGHGETRFSHLSVDYCLKVRARLQARRYTVSGIVPVATFGELPGKRRSLFFGGTAQGPDLSVLNADLARTVAQTNYMKAITQR
jgi:soluble lytic murein transglycosylase-like protein